MQGILYLYVGGPEKNSWLSGVRSNQLSCGPK